MAKKDGLTPMMQQYWDIKGAHKDKVLLFRMGDFFEMFHDDAVLASPIIGAALTSRNKKGGDNTPLCGVPHHSIAGPINKLLYEGHKIAICDQVEDPRQAKGIVKRAVTRILSPGMVYDPETLDSQRPNYMCSYDQEAIAFLETTTGEAFYYRTDHSSTRERLLGALHPAEVVLDKKGEQEYLQSYSLEGPTVTCHELPTGKDEAELPLCANRLLSYASYMQGEGVLATIGEFESRELEHRLEVSPLVIRHLEIFETYRGEKKGSLFQSINRTKTAAGARLLKNWLTFPLGRKDLIVKRLQRVQYWVEHLPELKKVREALSTMGDIERRLGKISNPNCNPRDFLALAASLRAGLQVQQMTSHLSWDSSKRDQIEEVIQKIERQIMEEPPVSTKNGFFTCQGFSSRLDELIELTSNSQQCLQDLESREREQTGISSLKIRYNNVFGYYIEVTKTHQSKVPSHYIRKQTLVNAERYITEELQELENRILSAKSKRSDLEFQFFEELKQVVLGHSADLLFSARQWSELDVLSASAWLAVEQNYCCPQFVEEGLFLKASRHPVVEQTVRQSFVPNDISLESHNCLLLTGPNMAGKSTVMRQVAVTSLMAQAGLFVPAKEARLPLFDRMFTRIGASDFLAEGMSTFMVEMKETAEMLENATAKSLVILDEVGRGTSTYDGMSLAQAILEYLMGNCRSMTLFATHYHELTGLDQLFPQVHNAHMSISDGRGKIQFLYTLSKGPANKSYGIQVGQLAGLPQSVTKRAQMILGQLEGGESCEMQMDLSYCEKPDGDVMQERGFEGPSLSPEQVELLESIRTMSLQTMTPIEAINKIAQWQKTLS